MEQSKYWELNTFQKASLSHEDLQAFRKVELMIKGIVCPEQPQDPKEVPSFHEFAKGQGTTVNILKLGYSSEFAISDTDKELLSEINLIQLKSKKINNEYIYSLGETTKLEIQTKVVYPEFSTFYAEYQSKYGDAVAIKEQWETYTKAFDAANKATSDLVDDWNQAKQNVALYSRIKKTYDEYLEMSNGNAEIAAGFLGKAFNDDDMDIYKQLFEEKALQ